jgi:RNA polymerase sigma factor (sigma-70 family)
LITDCTRLTDEQLLDLIARRGRRMGLWGADLDDAVQDVAPAVFEFEYDPDKWKNASQLTVLIAVIDRNLRSVIRRETRYRRNLRRAVEHLQQRYDLLDGPLEPSYEEPKELVVDVQAAVAELSEKDQSICTWLGYGLSIIEIAKRLGCDWHTVNRRITHVRQRFEKMGLDAWLTR